jgi:precorrin-3B C17-methyltransferase
VVSLGPGDPCLLCPQSRAALESATAGAGYSTYLDLLEPELLAGKAVVETGMTGEVERVQRAVDLALAGERVAVVSSGDAGIYAMAGLVLEVLEERGLLEDLPCEVLPGVPALAAAAALLGAPLTHDFACVSLSDLLTPWEVIARRLDAAASADFVLVLYNPRSKKRSGHLAKALEIIAAHRGPSTPAGVVSRAFRPGQIVTAATLGELDPGAVDMQSLVLVGNSATRLAGGRMLTPRGYAGKYDLKQDPAKARRRLANTGPKA